MCDGRRCICVGLCVSVPGSGARDSGPRARGPWPGDPGPRPGAPDPGPGNPGPGPGAPSAPLLWAPLSFSATLSTGKIKEETRPRLIQTGANSSLIL